MDDRVEVRLHVNFLTFDTFIYHTKYDILDHCTLALEFDCSLPYPGQYFLVLIVGSVSFPVPSSHLQCGCCCDKALFTNCDIGLLYFMCHTRMQSERAKVYGTG